MKLALITAIWKRHDLERLTIQRLIEQSKKFGFEIIIAGSEGEISENLAKGCHYVEVENYPVSNKHNALLTKAKELDVDGVVLIGSDCFLSNSFWTYASKFKKDEQNVLGLKDAYFYDTISKKMGIFNGYKNGTQTVGSGRYFSKSVLDKVNWKLWDNDLNSGLDTNCTNKLKALRIEDIGVTMKEAKAYIIDVKHSYSITNRSIVDLCDEVEHKEFISKFTKSVYDSVNKLEQPVIEIKEVKELIELDYFDGYKLFKANDKSEHLQAGKEYELTHELATILLNKGVIEL